jgi:hypothetical protein
LYRTVYSIHQRVILSQVGTVHQYDILYAEEGKLQRVIIGRKKIPTVERPPSITGATVEEGKLQRVIIGRKKIPTVERPPSITGATVEEGKLQRVIIGRKKIPTVERPPSITEGD